ncbi:MULTISPECIES: GntR family transcriptional regulator [Terrisporobacter]|uniref:GntR family transcriptional regulator n=2 Tax=Terrisporobacter TaxID=1505652 RepID=A0AAX2ZI01_9FIRM|nr:GntR family transcriptional regulator [Terrisporobacter hibernicus]UEL48968.1 GntR family transcriptional regulator [Terrisporobacter hibernicus]UPA31033.1 GntR family transcriptional regulator [Terrisporobacter glycolicus]SFJ48269.1 GntR family transcriptional regulator [Terrisporobacter glycolicus]
MDIVVSDSLPVALYEQIKNQIISQIVSKKLLPGQPLPSIRTLAREIKVSIITVKKSYEILESEGYIETVPSKGSFVSAKNTEKMRQLAIYEWECKLEEIVKRAKELDISLDEGMEIFKELYNLSD